MKQKPLTRLPKLPSFSSNKAFYYSALAHAILIVVFVVGIDWRSSSTPVTPAGAPQVMTAKAIDADKVMAEARKQQQLEQQKQDDLKRKEEEARRKVQEEEQKLKNLREQQEQEQRKVAEEKKRQEVEKKTRADAEQKAKAEAEKKAKAEADKKAKAEAEKKAKAEAEKKAKAEAAKKAAAEKALADALAAEEAEGQALADATELQRWLGRIQAAVQGAFVYPPGLPPGLKCKLLVRVVPGGDVVAASVVESSGNAVFDRQAETAVRKAAPLPVPAEARLFNQLREFYFTFDPNG
ncbi:MAG: cell envelope integrity protein TolA [Gammaproteobacteria bacterium]|nr:cell envelope integrity protein TolA [Gammaproteobacteria bacterium]